MSLSFCIITGGTRPDLIKVVIHSIQAQNVAEHEIIVLGKYKYEPGIIYIEAEDAAAGGRLGEMRNIAVGRARYENIMMLDDDIILSQNWYGAFAAYEKPFDILTSQIRVPDGGRYFDHVTVGGPKGHTFLAESEEDEYVYMTGGGGWVMKDYVAKRVAWDRDRGFYQEEDVDFSRRCQAQGFKISHNHKMVVFHADPTYTSIGRVVARRKEGRSHEWILREFDNLSLYQVFKRIIHLRKIKCYAEAADYVRIGIIKSPFSYFYKIIWKILVRKFGGDPPGTSWSPTGDPEYLDTLKKYKNI